MQDNDIGKLIANRIRQKRKELGISQEELAAKCNLHRTYIGAIERSEKRITVATLNKIAKALGEPITFFLG
jgi:transcriptional regulator with XRE-family HTH domain